MPGPFIGRLGINGRTFERHVWVRLPAAAQQDCWSLSRHWVASNSADLLRMAGGVIDVAAGAALSLGRGRLAVVPGVGLMAIGVDQVVTGEAKYSGVLLEGEAGSCEGCQARE